MLHFHCLVLNWERAGEKNLSSNRIYISKAPFSVQAPWGYCMKSFWAALRCIGADIKAALIPRLAQTHRHLRSLHSQARKDLNQLLPKPTIDPLKRWPRGREEESSFSRTDLHLGGRGTAVCTALSLAPHPLSEPCYPWEEASSCPLGTQRVLGDPRHLKDNVPRTLMLLVVGNFHAICLKSGLLS